MTVIGKTLEVLHTLEKDVVRSPIARLIPDWFEPDPAEWRKITNVQITFVLLLN